MAGRTPASKPQPDRMGTSRHGKLVPGTSCLPPVGRRGDPVRDTGEVLRPNEQRVLDAATRQAESLIADPNHTVAAAAMDTTGRIFTGVNVHHFTGGPCAELVALGAAVSASAGPLATIVAVGDAGRGVLAPCGRCRQVILDQHPDCFVIVPTDEGPDCRPIRALLPFSYVRPEASPERFIRFNPAYYERVRTGLKTATIRHDDPVALGPAWLVFEDDDGYRRLRAVVDEIEVKRLDELDGADAEHESVSSLAALRAGLQRHYPGLPPDAVVSVVRFHLDDGA